MASIMKFQRSTKNTDVYIAVDARNPISQLYIAQSARQGQPPQYILLDWTPCDVEGKPL